MDEFDDDPGDNSVESELTQYINTFVAPQTCPDVLQWWKSNSSKYPGLAKIARNTLCVMATSAASERNFSVVSSMRTR